MQLLGCSQRNKHCGMHHFASVSAFQTSITRSKRQQRKLHVYPQLHRYPAFRVYGHSLPPFGRELCKAVQRKKQIFEHQWTHHILDISSPTLFFETICLCFNCTQIYTSYMERSLWAATLPVFNNTLSQSRWAARLTFPKQGSCWNACSMALSTWWQAVLGSWQWQPRCFLPGASQTWRSEGTHLTEESMSNIF